MGGVVGEIDVGDAQLDAVHHLAGLVPEFLAGIVMRAEAVAQIAVQPRRHARPVRYLVDQDPTIGFETVSPVNSGHFVHSGQDR